MITKILGLGIAAFTLLFAGANSAQAIGTVPWSLSVGSGKASGNFVGNEVTHAWRVTGVADDYRSGDDCTKFKVHTRQWVKVAGGGYTVWAVFKEVRLCGGADANIDWSGTDSTAAGYIKVQVCQDYTVGFDDCVEKRLYLT